MVEAFNTAEPPGRRPLKPKLLEIQCVYCSEVKPPPKKKGEHIILDGLGGHATILDVCKECNQWLGDNLDIEFLRNSHIAFYRYFDPAIDDGEIGKIQFVPSRYGWWDAKMHNSGQLEVKRQVGITDAQWVMVGRIDQQDEFEKALAELKGTDPDYNDGSSCNR